MRIGGKVAPWIWLAVLATIGLLLIALPNVVSSWHEILGVIHDVGIAFLVASILGFTIDRWLKTEIVSNVFEAAMGHVLPREFQEEIRYVIGHKFICEKHVMGMNIEKIDHATVRVVYTIERVIRNITSTSQKMTPYIHIDEWGFDQEKCEVLDCQAEMDGRVFKFKGASRKEDSTILGELAPLNVAPGNQIKVFYKAKEIRRINDDISFVFTAPTTNPELTVGNLPDDLECICAFGTSRDDIEISKYMRRHVLNGTYFPLQRVRVRWWPKQFSVVKDAVSWP